MHKYPSRIPRYEDDTDYTTNAPSYYDDLARKNKLIKTISKRIWEYDEILDTTLEEVESILKETIDKIGDGFNQEINELLIKWLEDGTLDHIINETLMNKKADIIYVDDLFNSLEKVLNDEIDIVKNDINDFKQETGENINNLERETGEKLDTKVDNLAYYHELEMTTHRSLEYDTTYYLIKIPKYDVNGERIILKQGIASDEFSSVGTETVRAFSKRKEATMVSNLSPSTTQSRIIHKGKILRNSQSTDPYRPTLAFNDEGKMRSYDYTVTAQQILEDGYTEAMTSFSNLITNGNINTSAINSFSDYLKNVNPRTVVSQDSDGNTYIMVSDGRMIGERGFTAMETADIMLQHNMTFAQMLDGGGSSQVTMYHSNINKLSDRKGSRSEGFIYGRHERSRSNFLYVGKDIKNDPLTKIFAHLGNINKSQSDRISEYENLKYSSDNWISLSQYLVNGWEAYSSSGALTPRAWIMPNNTIYLVGAVKEGVLETACLTLPPEYRPNFSYHFITPGESEKELFKITVNTSGNVVVYPWSEGANNSYVKLDGLFFPINPNYNEGV